MAHTQQELIRGGGLERASEGQEALNQSIKNPHKATHGQGEADPSTATVALCA